MEEEARETRISWFLTFVLVLLVVAAFVLVGLILYRYYGQVQPKTPVQFEIERWEATVKERPNDADAHYYLAVVYRQNGDYDKSEKEIKKALDINPSSNRYRYELGTLYVTLKDYEKAAKEFQTIVDKDADNALAWFQLGAIQMREENYEEAVVAFKNVLRVEPTYGNVHRELGKAYEKLGEKEKAIEEYKAALKFLPEDEEAKAGLERLGAPQ